VTTSVRISAGIFYFFRTRLRRNHTRHTIVDTQLTVNFTRLFDQIMCQIAESNLRFAGVLRIVKTETSLNRRSRCRYFTRRIRATYELPGAIGGVVCFLVSLQFRHAVVRTLRFDSVPMNRSRLPWPIVGYSETKAEQDLDPVPDNFSTFRENSSAGLRPSGN
jgi:hypothetical protein